MDNSCEMYTKGQQMYEDFVEQSLKSSSTKLFHDPISKSKVKLFKNLIKKLSVMKGHKTYVTEVNRNITGQTDIIFSQDWESCQLEDALKYPLSPVPLSLAFSKDTHRKQVNGSS